MVIANILIAASIEVPHLMILLEMLHPHAQKLRQCSTCVLRRFTPDIEVG